MDAFHKLILRRIQELREEGEEARARRLEEGLRSLDDRMMEMV